MNNSYELILTIGCILILGLMADTVGKHTHLPRVTLLLLLGLGIGVNGLNLVPKIIIDNYDVISDMALVMIGFLVGGKLSSNMIKNHGLEVLIVTFSVVMVTFIIVSAGFLAVGISLPIAIMLGCISTATAPAATLDVIMEEKVNNIFIDRLIAIVALDDLIGLILFSLCLALLPAYFNQYDQIHTPILIASKEIVGAIFLGVMIGIPAAYLTGRAVPGQPLLIEALGLIMICGGLAILLGVSYLISAIVMGAVVANFANHHEYSFHEIENIEWPIMMIFFTLAGASIELVSLIHVLHFVLIFIFLRVIGKIIGAFIGCRLVSADTLTSKWLGAALMPQAGVAIGMSLVASNYLPQHKELMLTIIISATIVFEIFGPIFTRLAIHKSIQS